MTVTVTGDVGSLASWSFCGWRKVRSSSWYNFSGWVCALISVDYVYTSGWMRGRVSGIQKNPHQLFLKVLLH